jgi:hypothetical protein
MAASAWRVYNEAKKYLLTGDIDLNTSVLSMKIVKGTSAAKCSDYTRSTFASCGTACVGNPAVVTLTGVAVTTVGSAKQIMFDSTACVFTASAGTVTSCQYGVIGISGGKALAWCKLSTAAFDVAVGNTLTVTPSATGYFTLTGGTT